MYVVQFLFFVLEQASKEEAQQAAPGVWKASSSNLCEFCLSVFATAPTILKRAVFFHSFSIIPGSLTGWIYPPFFGFLYYVVGRGSGCDDNKEEILDGWSLSNFRRNLGNIINPHLIA